MIDSIREFINTVSDLREAVVFLIGGAFIITVAIIALVSWIQNKLKASSKTMKKYTALEETPMGYHKFVHYVWIPLHAVYIIYTMFTTFNGYVYINELTIGLFLYLLAEIILSIFAFIGFFSLKPYAWKCMIAILIISTIAPLIIYVLLYFYFGNTESSYNFTFIFAFSIPTLIYYLKRKPLFSKGYVEQLKTTNTVPHSIISNVTPFDKSSLAEMDEMRRRITEEIRMCEEAYPDFDYNAELQSFATGTIFRNLINRGTPIIDAYEIVRK